MNSQNMTRVVPCAMVLEERAQARGCRMMRDDLVAALREGAMTLPGWVMNEVLRMIDQRNLALALVPADWAMTHGELASTGLLVNPKAVCFDC